MKKANSVETEFRTARRRKKSILREDQCGLEQRRDPHQR
jgi:hypothetical protein